jgi:DNA/RNA endonuclease YhcR with UshA esterase domain
LKKQGAMKLLLAMTLAMPFQAVWVGSNQAVMAEGPTDPAPVIQPKVVNENAGKKILFDNTHGQTAGAADWVIDGGFSDFANGLAQNGYYVKELRKTTPITLEDLQGYDAFVIGEANIPYKASEQDAMLRYVQNGGAIFFIGDHYNADRNKNRWDASEVFNGYRRGAWTNPAKGMSEEEAASSAMQGVVSSDWLGQNFGVRFRYNALGDVNATNIVAPEQSFGITSGVNAVAMHAGSTLAILDPKKAKGIVYLPQTNAAWANAVDQGVYAGGGLAEGPYVAVSKIGLGKAAFIGDSSPVEDATPKYLREENGQTKKTYDGYKELDDAKLLINLVNWLTKKESYTSLDQVSGLQLDAPTPLLPMEEPSASTEPQPEPWAPPAAGYKWYDSTTFKPGSYGAPNATQPQPQPGNATYSFVHQAELPTQEAFQVRVVVDNLAPNSTLSGLNIGLYLPGGMQVGQVQNADGTWPTSYGYSANFSVTADQLGHAVKDLTMRVKPGTNPGAATLRLRLNTSGTTQTNVKTEAVTLANVAAEPLPNDKPPVPAAISIAEARQKPQNTVVTVEGVVTTKPGVFGGQGFYLQDATGGLYVYQNQSGFNVGDRLRITAPTTVYNTEFELSDLIAVEKLGTAELPNKVVVESVNETNQGQLVTLEDVTIQNLQSAAPSGSFEFDAVKGEKSTRVRVDGRIGLTLADFPYRNGQVVTVSGVASIFKGTYQLKPLSLADFVADVTPPTTSAQLSGVPNSAGWYNQDVTVTLTATDDKSGVASTEYQTTEGIWYPYAAPFVISADGVHAVKFRSVDKSGNVEADQSITVKLDRTGPAVSVVQDGLPVHDVSIDGQFSLAVEASDALSGVASAELFLNEQRVESGSSFDALSLGLGTHTVRARAVDAAGNASEVNYLFRVETNFAAIHNLIDRFAKEGQMKNDGIRKSLESQLTHAERQLEKGKATQAAHHLEHMITILDKHLKAENITAYAHGVLKANAEYMLQRVVE